MKKQILTSTLLLISMVTFSQAGNKPVVKIENKEYYLVDASGSNTMVNLTGGEGDANYNLKCKVLSFYYPVITDNVPNYGTYGSEAKFFCTCDKTYMKTTGVGNVIAKKAFNTYFGPMDGGDGFKVNWMVGSE